MPTGSFMLGPVTELVDSGADVPAFHKERPLGVDYGLTQCTKAEAALRGGFFVSVRPEPGIAPIHGACPFHTVSSRSSPTATR